MESISAADSKIIILYLTDRAPGVSYQMLMNKCLDSLFTDFFTFSSAYSELVSGNLIDARKTDTGTGEVIGNNETVNITTGGHAVLEDVFPTLNIRIREAVERAGEELKAEAAEINKVKAFVSPADNGKYEILLTSVSDGREVTVKLFEEDKKKADSIASEWRRNASGLTDSLFADLLK